MSEDDFEATLTDRFVEHGADEDTARAAAERVAAFREDWDEDLTAEEVVAALEDAADTYDRFEHRFDCAVGDLAAGVERCTDSREYRLSGFGDLAADPEQGG